MTTTVTIRADRGLIRSTHRSNRFVLADIVAPLSHREHGRAPVNLAFVVDRSGSMGGQKIELAKQAVEESIARLHDDDRFAIVVYDEQIDIVVASTSATPEARHNAVDRLRAIDARGSTDLGGGWLRGCEQVADTLSEAGVNRCLLLTDGLANVGIIDHDELARHAGELRARGVSTTTFGVGEDFDEVLLQTMAAAGGGHFYYIADATSIRDLVTSEVGETLDVVAREVVLAVTGPDGIGIECLSTYPARDQHGRTEIVLGDLTADERVSVVLRLRFRYGEIGRSTGALFTVSDRDAALSDGGTRLTWAYADDRANDGQARDRDVDRAVARVFAARARQEAVGLNRRGDFTAARDVLKGTARRIAKYAGRDTELRAILAELEAELDRFDKPMLEMSLKMAYAQSSYLSRSRSAMGKAVKADRPDPTSTR
jgi:Ca-activated chloride channel family protein